MFARRNFHQFHHLLAWAKFLSHEFFLSGIDDYTEDMVTFTALAKTYSSEYFCNARIAGIGEIFVQRKFLAIWYMHITPVPSNVGGA